TVMAWGYNAQGQLGDGTNTNRSTPVAVINLTGATSVSAGTHSVAVKSDGTIWSFGTNTYGQLGNGTNVNSNVPTLLVHPTSAAQVATPAFSPDRGRYWQPKHVSADC